MAFSTFRAMALATAVLAGAQAQAATLVARYTFANTLASSVAGAPDLVLVDPLGTSGFVTDTVNGQSRTVLEFNGAQATDQQGGLQFDSTGLLPSDSWSIAFTFQLFDRTGQWRRLVDTLDRVSDTGFYVAPNNRLNVFPEGGSGADFTTGQYENVVLTVGPGGTVTAFIEGTAELSVISTGLNIGANGIISLFLDDIAVAQEWSAGRIAVASFYSGVLTPGEVDDIDDNPLVVPEPATWALMISGFGLVGVAMRRRERLLRA